MFVFLWRSPFSKKAGNTTTRLAGDIFQMTTLFIARTDNNTEEKKQEDQRTKK
jgi:hypothetical protein